MKHLLLALILWGGGDHERGLSLYAKGDYLGAAQAFQAALAEDPDNAEIAFNMALALLKAGDAEAAETAAEQAATLSDGALSHLRDGLLGSLRYQAAQVKQEEDLQAALELAQRARSNFLRGALSQAGGPELRRNLERTNLLIDELKKKIEEQEKQEQDEDQKEEGDEENEDQKQEGDEEDKEKKEDKEGKENEEKQDPKQGEEQDQEPKPEPGEEPEQEPKPEQGEEEEPEPQQDEETQPEPAQEPEEKQLSSEQARRLQEALAQLQEQKKQMRALMRSKRPKVKKDW